MLTVLCLLACGAVLRSQETVAQLADTLTRSTDLAERSKAARDLAQRGEAAKPAVPALLRALRQDNYYGVRENCAHTLGILGVQTAEVRTALLEAATLAEPDSREGHPFWRHEANQRYYFHVRYAAVRALTRLGPSGIREAMRVLDAPEGHVEASDVLAQVKSPEVEQALRRYRERIR